MAWDGRVTESEIVGRYIDEAVSGEDRGRRWSLEALTAVAEVADGVRIRGGVVEGNRGAVHVGDCRERPGFARHGYHARDGGRASDGLSRQHRVIGAVGHLVAVEAVLERDRQVLRKLVVVLIKGNPLLEMRAGIVRGRIRAHFLVADQASAVAPLALVVGWSGSIRARGSGPGQRDRARDLRGTPHPIRCARDHHPSNAVPGLSEPHSSKNARRRQNRTWGLSSQLSGKGPSLRATLRLFWGRRQPETALHQRAVR